MTISEDRVKQNCFPSTISNVTNDKNELRKTVSLASFQKPQLQSVSIFKFAIRVRRPFVFPVIFIPSFHVLSNHFEVPLSLVAFFTVWIYKFSETGPLNSWTDCSGEQTPLQLWCWVPHGLLKHHVFPGELACISVFEVYLSDWGGRIS